MNTIHIGMSARNQSKTVAQSRYIYKCPHCGYLHTEIQVKYAILKTCFKCGKVEFDKFIIGAPKMEKNRR